MLNQPFSKNQSLAIEYLASKNFIPVELKQEILKQNNINLPDENGMTILHFIVQGILNGKIDKHVGIDILYDLFQFQGIELLQINNKGETALHLALDSSQNNVEISHLFVRQLIKEEGLFYQLRSYFLKEFPQVNAIDGEGTTLLMAAVKRNHIGLVKLLIAHNPNILIDLKDKKGMSALQYAKRDSPIFDVLESALNLQQAKIHSTTEPTRIEPNYQFIIKKLNTITADEGIQWKATNKGVVISSPPLPKGLAKKLAKKFSDDLKESIQESSKSSKSAKYRVRLNAALIESRLKNNIPIVPAPLPPSSATPIKSILKKDHAEKVSKNTVQFIKHPSKTVTIEDLGHEQRKLPKKNKSKTKRKIKDVTSFLENREEPTLEPIALSNEERKAFESFLEGPNAPRWATRPEDEFTPRIVNIMLNGKGQYIAKITHDSESKERRHRKPQTQLITSRIYEELKESIVEISADKDQENRKSSLLKRYDAKKHTGKQIPQDFADSRPLDGMIALFEASSGVLKEKYPEEQNSIQLEKNLIEYLNKINNNPQTSNEQKELLAKKLLNVVVVNSEKNAPDVYDIAKHLLDNFSHYIMIDNQGIKPKNKF